MKIYVYEHIILVCILLLGSTIGICWRYWLLWYEASGTTD